MTESVVNIRVMKSRGFSLLEIIIVLAFIGIILAMAAVYAKKMIDEKTRQASAEAIAQEVYGVLQFVNTDSIEVFTSKNINDVQKVTNPLYQLTHMRVYPEAKDGTPDATLKGLEQNPIWQAHQHNDITIDLDVTKNYASPYVVRNISKFITSPITNTVEVTDGINKRYSHSLNFSQARWKNNSRRAWFTDSGCPENAGVGNAVYFKQQFLSCNENPVLRNSEIELTRLDLVNSDGGVTIDRVDMYVAFNPIDGNHARLEQFITPLINAFRTRKIVPNMNHVYLVRSMLPDYKNNNAWVLLDKKNGNQALATTPTTDLAVFTDLPDMIGMLQADHVYGLRFTFDGHDDYLRTDGLNAATKICWNTSTGVAGPCLEASSEKLLVLTQRNGQEPANLQVENVISKGSHMTPDGRVEPEYYTAPQIQYKTFSSVQNSAPTPYYRLNTDDPATGKTILQLCTSPTHCGVKGIDEDEIVEEAHGAIAIPRQVCPKLADGKDMYPRVSASISSVVSGLPIDKNDLGLPYSSHIFESEASSLSNLNDTQKAQISINKLGGVVIQITQKDNQWRLSSFVGTQGNDTDQRAWQYYNPPWLSVMVSTWCSSIPQP